MSNALLDFKPKWVAWYQDDFAADRIVQRWKPVQRHLYRALLIESHYNAERPFLPDDDDQLWVLADADSKQQWQEHRAVIISKFEAFEESGKRLLKNKRVFEEWQKAAENLEQKKNAGAASAKSRAARKAAKEKKTEAEPKSEDSELAAPQVLDLTAQFRLEMEAYGRINDDSSNIVPTFRATQKHGTALQSLCDRAGLDVALGAWWVFLHTFDFFIEIDGRKDLRKWPLNDFLQNGQADALIQRVKTLVERGAKRNALLLLLDWSDEIGALQFDIAAFSSIYANKPFEESNDKFFKADEQPGQIAKLVGAQPVEAASA